MKYNKKFKWEYMIKLHYIISTSVVAKKIKKIYSFFKKP